MSDICFCQSTDLRLFGHSDSCPRHADLPRRALHIHQKRLLLTRLFLTWAELPELRLGQLLEVARAKISGNTCDLFMLEDQDLIEAAEMIQTGEYTAPK